MPVKIPRRSSRTSGTDNGIEYHGRTNATRAGFDFTCTSDGGQGWTGIVYRDDDVTYRATIAAGHVRQARSSPRRTGTAIEVYDGTIEPTPGTTGYDPACAAAGPLSAASPTLGALVGAGVAGQTDPIPLSYLLKQMQNGIVQADGWVRDLADQRARRGRLDGQLGRMGARLDGLHAIAARRVTCMWSSSIFGWDPDLTDEEFGPLRVLDSVDKAYHGAGLPCCTEAIPPKGSTTSRRRPSRSSIIAR